MFSTIRIQFATVALNVAHLFCVKNVMGSILSFTSTYPVQFLEYEQGKCLDSKQKHLITMYSQNFQKIKGLVVCYVVWLGSMKGMGLMTNAYCWYGLLLRSGWLSNSSTATPHRSITTIRINICLSVWNMIFTAPSQDKSLKFRYRFLIYFIIILSVSVLLLLCETSKAI